MGADTERAATGGDRLKDVLAPDPKEVARLSGCYEVALPDDLGKEAIAKEIAGKTIRFHLLSEPKEAGLYFRLDGPAPSAALKKSSWRIIDGDKALASWGTGFVSLQIELDKRAAATEAKARVITDALPLQEFHDARGARSVACAPASGS